MTKTNSGDKKPVKRLYVLLLLLDTSWRVAVPMIGLSMLGHYIDERTGHKITFLLIGLFTSLLVAVLLVYRQLCIVFPEQFGKDKKET